MDGERQKMRDALLAIPEDYWPEHVARHAGRLSQAQRGAAGAAVRRMAAILEDCAPLERAALLYRMFARNIRYDYETCRSPERNARHIAFNYYGAIRGKAVCAGIAELYALALVAAGVDAVIVLGFAQGGGGAGLHAWNKLRLGGRWDNADVTWDLASCGRPGQPEFFLRSDAWMEAHRHYTLAERYPAAPAEPDSQSRRRAAEIFQRRGVDEILWQVWQNSRRGMP